MVRFVDALLHEAIGSLTTFTQFQPKQGGAAGRRGLLGRWGGRRPSGGGVSRGCIWACMHMCAVAVFKWVLTVYIMHSAKNEMQQRRAEAGRAAASGVCRGRGRRGGGRWGGGGGGRRKEAPPPAAAATAATAATTRAVAAVQRGARAHPEARCVHVGIISLCDCPVALSSSSPSAPSLLTPL